MYLSKLKIKNLGLLKNVSLNFKTGFNVIFGDNASGKTTLLFNILDNLENFKKIQFYGRSYLDIKRGSYYLRSFDSNSEFYSELEVIDNEKVIRTNNKSKIIEIIDNEKLIRVNDRSKLLDELNNQKIILFDCNRNILLKRVGLYTNKIKKAYVIVMNSWLNQLKKYNNEISIIEEEIKFSHRIFDSHDDFIVSLFFTYIFEMKYLKTAKILIADGNISEISTELLIEIFNVTKELVSDLQIIITANNRIYSVINEFPIFNFMQLKRISKEETIIISPIG